MTATWKFGSTDLTSAGAYNVVDFSSSYEIPQKRGDNPTIPLREGRLHVDKVYDQRTLNLGMYIRGSTYADFVTKMNTMRALFGKGNQQFLQRTLPGASVQKVGAEVTKFDVVLKSSRYARATVDFILASPFFRSTTKTTDTQTVNASPKTYTLTQPGTAEDRSAILTLTGPLTNPKLTNLITDPVSGLAVNVWVGYTGVLAGGEVIVIDTVAMTCKNGAINCLNLLTHSGDPYFMVLKAGANSMKIESAVHTTGTVKVEFYAPYF